MLRVMSERTAHLSFRPVEPKNGEWVRCSVHLGDEENRLGYVVRLGPSLWIATKGSRKFTGVSRKVAALKAWGHLAPAGVGRA
jgi:hypothetical protein